MAFLKPDRRNIITRFRPRPGSDASPERHAWVIPHLITLITYAERHGLSAMETALVEATETIAPTVRNVPPTRRSSRREDSGNAQILKMTDRGPR
ncbi:hypothetical protein FAZ78_13450 [Cereibacter changlensis]|uniref:Uncharacterized protein n=1 Tax=Cereibacter changlensis TaxID=402884 RepID=A0A4U0YYQ0_9RHOB|nr:hypothetical protein [Cereibacter changlensis]TKA96069.1 hypothetical protein FAZ78_13450 [Cereibacter changlensis]